MATRRRPSTTSGSTTEKDQSVNADAEESGTQSPKKRSTTTRTRSSRAAAKPDNPQLTHVPARAPAPKSGQTEDNPRFHYFIIDSGWKSHSARVLRENFRMIREFENHDPLYVLTREQSLELIRANPDLIGKDPILLVHDLHAKGGRGPSGYHGFRLCLGVIKNSEQSLIALQEFLRFIADHRSSRDIEKDLQKKLHREGLEGAIEVIRESAQEMMA